MSTAPYAAALPHALISSPNEVIEASTGLTAREQAAIALRVPDSGNDWLDAMIRTAQRNAYAGQAMQGWLGSYGSDQVHPAGQGTEKFAAELAYKLADAMLAGAATPTDGA